MEILCLINGLCGTTLSRCIARMGRVRFPTHPLWETTPITTQTKKEYQMRYKMIKKLVRYFLWIDIGKDKYNNSLNVLLLKSIFGALRPWWRVAYDSCSNGNDFNVPELWFEQSDNCYRGFKDKHHDLLIDFCSAIADELGYYNADERSEDMVTMEMTSRQKKPDIPNIVTLDPVKEVSND